LVAWQPGRNALTNAALEQVLRDKPVTCHGAAAECGNPTGSH
jgi:hypothetical protein